MKKNQKATRQLQIRANCEYRIKSGKRCVGCRFCGTTDCIYPANTSNIMRIIEKRC